MLIGKKGSIWGVVVITELSNTLAQLGNDVTILTPDVVLSSKKGF